MSTTWRGAEHPEPATGLDLAARNQVWDIVRALAQAGTTVLLTTQYLAEADELAARIAVIDHGRLIAEGTPGELRAAGGTGMLHLRLADATFRADAADLLHRLLGDPAAPAGTDPAALSIAADPSRAADALAELGRAGIAVTGFSLDQPSLEEVFPALTSNARGRRDAQSATA